jgi:hypothetical protein
MQLYVPLLGNTHPSAVLPSSATGIPQWMSPFLLLVHLIVAVPMRDASPKTCFVISMAQKEGLGLFHLFMN